MNKRLLLFLLATICSYFTQAKVPGIIPLKIEKVTVFPKGALIEHTAEIELKKGDNELIFSGVPSEIIKNSLEIKVPDNITVTSIEHYKDETGSHLTIKLDHPIRDSINTYYNQTDSIKTLIEAVDISIAMLLRKKSLFDSSKTRITEQDFKNWAEYFLKKLENLKITKYRLVAEQEKIQKYADEAINIRDHHFKNIYSSIALLKAHLFAPSSGKVKIIIRYCMTDCGWLPCYDVIQHGTDKPLEIQYKAVVFQHSETSWNNVVLSVSTRNNLKDFETPELETKTVKLKKSTAKKRPELSNPVESIIVFPSNGQDNAQIWGTADVKINNYDEDKVPDSTTLNRTDVDTTYDIPYTQTINNCNLNYAFNISKVMAPVVYENVCHPSIVPGVFTVAKIPNYENLKLLEGKTNVFSEHRRICSGEMKLSEKGDSMVITMGKNPNFQVTKEIVADECTVKINGSQIIETTGYDINIKNTGNTVQQVLVEDVVPVSKEENIVVENLKIGKGSLDSVTGVVHWTVNLKPAEVYSCHVGYTIKYPEGASILVKRK